MALNLSTDSYPFWVGSALGCLRPFLGWDKGCGVMFSCHNYRQVGMVYFNVWGDIIASTVAGAPGINMFFYAMDLGLAGDRQI